MTWRLSELTELGAVNSYAAYAASRTCGVPLRTITSARSRRSPMDECVFMALDVVTPYLMLTGYDFDQTHFDQVIASILQTGSSGIGSHDPVTEAQLVDAVRAAASGGGDLTQAFQSAAELNASTFSLATATTEEEAIAPIDPGAGPSGLARPSGASRQRTGIGRYGLDLRRMYLGTFRQNYPEVMPRVRVGDQWVQSTERFTVRRIGGAVTPPQDALRSGSCVSYFKAGGVLDQTRLRQADLVGNSRFPRCRLDRR